MQELRLESIEVERSRLSRQGTTVYTQEGKGDNSDSGHDAIRRGGETGTRNARVQVLKETRVWCHKVKGDVGKHIVE